jgi:hypothetical protein
MAGSTENTWNGVDTVTAVTFAFTALASAIPYRMAFLDKSEPSVGMRM